MKTPLLYLSLFAALVAIPGHSAAQDFTGGTVTYQQITAYNFQKLAEDLGKKPEIEQWLASLPVENRNPGVLYFTEKAALYEKNASDQEAPSEALVKALYLSNISKPPRPDLKKVFYNFEENRKTDQVVFMTRDFRVESEIARKPWKLINKRVKVLDYMCMGAEMTIGKQTITAWFTSEIPVSAGPDAYYGLPGLILVIEVNGETVFMATSVDLTAPKEGVLSEPDDGKKVSREEFNRIIVEKEQEFKELGGKREWRGIK